MLYVLSEILPFPYQIIGHENNYMRCRLVKTNCTFSTQFDDQKNLEQVSKHMGKHFSRWKYR